ncbi:lactoylglutathione lyase-like lyase [Xenococcus sp. PCC 7305]|uniref:VOC family protein n=1 Tax=Xenococcus sp. PCC 7305 TaxID=102125 RepID=UPI0002AC9D70|nr:VOC family protein [Xenococcus sp. PCC 7305]ELS02389.1 lactoylglutathione lyase-like lyase [Xenococcus sp. PCC 7305]
MLKDGIAQILISVSNLDKSARFFQDNFGMSVVAEYSLDAKTINQLWNCSLETTGNVIILKNDEQTTSIKLIQFQPNSGKSIRTTGNTTDYGLFTIAFRAKDVDAAYDRFSQQGYQFVCPPITYTFSLGPVTVKEAIMTGPDDIPLVFIERLSEPIPELKEDFGSMLDTSQVVTDIAEVTKFYSDILGLTTIFNEVLPEGMIDNILNLPAGTESRMAFIKQPGSKTPFLEFIQTSVPGQNLSSTGKIPNLGLFAIALTTDNLTELTQKLQQNNIKILAETIEIPISNHETAKAIAVEAPNGVHLQFWEEQ